MNSSDGTQSSEHQVEGRGTRDAWADAGAAVEAAKTDAWADAGAAAKVKVEPALLITLTPFTTDEIDVMRNAILEGENYWPLEPPPEEDGYEFEIAIRQLISIIKARL